MPLTRLLGERYTPLYFLNALVAAGFAFSAYMYVYWLCKLNNTSLPTFSVLSDLITRRDWGLVAISAVAIGLFTFFTILHARLLIWNIRNLRAWMKLVPFKALMASKDRTLLLLIPGTLALSLCLVFCIAVIALPFFDAIKDYIAPVIALGLYVVGGWAVHTYMDLFLSRLKETAAVGPLGTNLGQWVSVFSLALIALPLALIAQNVTNKTTILFAGFGALVLFLLACGIILLRFAPYIKTLTGQVLPAETGALFWFAGGVLSLLALLNIQIDGGLSRAFHASQNAKELFFSIGLMGAVCAFFFVIGRTILTLNKTYTPLVSGTLYTPGLYGVLCPTLILGIFYTYLVNVCFVVGLGMLAFSFSHIACHLPLLIVQGWAARLFFTLNARIGKAPQKK